MIMIKMNSRVTYKALLKAIIIIFPACLLILLGSVYKDKIVISEIYPIEIVVGEPFNISIVGDGFNSGDEIYINGERCDTTFGNEGWITCTVNEKLYSKAGTLKVQVLRKQDEKIIIRSNRVKILVKEK